MQNGEEKTHKYSLRLIGMHLRKPKPCYGEVVELTQDGLIIALLCLECGDGGIDSAQYSVQSSIVDQLGDDDFTMVGTPVGK